MIRLVGVHLLPLAEKGLIMSDLLTFKEIIDIIASSDDVSSEDRLKIKTLLNLYYDKKRFYETDYKFDIVNWKLVPVDKYESTWDSSSCSGYDEDWSSSDAEC